jgi:hypothetical protein
MEERLLRLLLLATSRQQQSRAATQSNVDDDDNDDVNEEDDEEWFETELDNENDDDDVVDDVVDDATDVDDGDAANGDGAVVPVDDRTRLPLGTAGFGAADATLAFVTSTRLQAGFAPRVVAPNVFSTSGHLAHRLHAVRPPSACL